MARLAHPASKCTKTHTPLRVEAGQTNLFDDFNTRNPRPIALHQRQSHFHRLNLNALGDLLHVVSRSRILALLAQVARVAQVLPIHTRGTPKISKGAPERAGARGAPRKCAASTGSAPQKRSRWKGGTQGQQLTLTIEVGKASLPLGRWT